MSDEQIKKTASFRSSKRFPAVVWRSKVNGAVIARSSQPNVGLLAWRLNEDELLIKAIADCSYLNNNKSQHQIHNDHHQNDNLAKNQTQDNHQVTDSSSSNKQQNLNNTAAELLNDGNNMQRLII
jgi:hypothetical protein